MNEMFVPCPVFEKDEPLIIHLAGITYSDKSYKIIRPSSSISCFEYVISGEGTIIKEKPLYSKEGDTYFLLAGNNHEYYSNEDFPWTKIWINASGPLINSLINAYSLHNQCIVHCNTEKYFRKIHSLLISKEYTSKEIAAKISIVFHELIQTIAANKNPENDAIDDAAIIKDYIDKNIYKQITIADLSQLIFKTDEHTIRIFKKAYGMTPYKYYTDNRIKIAQNMLRDTDFSVKEIAFTLNFCDEHYFTNLFKSKTGKTPMKYRHLYTFHHLNP